MNNLVDEHVAARYIAKSVSWMRQARCKSKTAAIAGGPPFFKLGRNCRYRISDLDAWLEQHRCELVKND